MTWDGFVGENQTITYNVPSPWAEEQVSATQATPTNSAVYVNNKNVVFDAYVINNNNYFKLRDLAYILSGTEKQFDVSWDSTNNAIYLTSGKAYTKVGGEMVGNGTGSKTPLSAVAVLYIDGDETSFTAYNIDGNNYFKLRDIGAALNLFIARVNSPKL